MITLTRSLARQLRAVFRRALNLSTKGCTAAVRFHAGPDGLHVSCRHPQAAVEFRADGDHPADELIVPLNMLADCEARRNDSVTLERKEASRVVARWDDAGIPQRVECDVPPENGQAALPAIPETMTENATRLLGALHDAMETTDREAIRYATDRIRLEGSTGRILATDGRQILVQTGFEFPFADDVLFPKTNVFGCRDLPQETAVFIGKRDEWITLQIGDWRLHYAVDHEGRYPDVESFLVDAKTAAATCRLSEVDADFLLQSMKRLPGNDDINLPVTVDLNGSLAIRAVAESQPQPTELVFADSELTGQPLRINTNRGYLHRAVKLGFRELCLHGPESPIVCHDPHRSFVWAVLGKEGVIEPVKDAIRITSGGAVPEKQLKPGSAKHQAAERRSTKPSTPATRRTTPTMSQTKTNGNGRAGESNGRVSDQVGVDAVIEQAEAVKASLRDTVTKVGELISTLKRHKKQAKIVQSTIASLRQLQTLDV